MCVSVCVCICEYLRLKLDLCPCHQSYHPHPSCLKWLQLLNSIFSGIFHLIKSESVLEFSTRAYAVNVDQAILA